MTHESSTDKEKGVLRKDQNQLIFAEGFSFSGYERDGLYLNRANGKFLDISGVSGIDSISDGRGAVFADFDNDGDLDVFLTAIQGSSHLLFRNNVGQDGHFLRVALEGKPGSGRDAFGSVVRVKTSAGILTKIKAGGSGFLSQHDPRLLFGLGNDTKAEWVEVTWPNGRAERFDVEARAGSTLLLREGAGRADLLTLRRTQLPEPLTQAEVAARKLKVAVGKPMPDLPLATLDGGKTSLEQQRRAGRQMLINVWATWCVPCGREMPELEALRAGFAARGIDLIGVSVDTEPDADVPGYVAAKKVRYPIFVGGVSAIEQLYIGDELSVPLSLLVDANGIVKEIISGASDKSLHRLARLAGTKSAGGK